MAACLGLVLWLGYHTTRTVPSNFPVGKNFIVNEDESLRSISVRLEEEHYIHSALWFRAWVSFLGRDRHVQLGGYVFDKPYVLGAIIKKMVSGNPDMPLISVTVPEGSTTEEVALLVKKELPAISVKIFEENVSLKHGEGKLFPSTYFLLPSTTEERIVDMMMKTFEKKYDESFKEEKIPDLLKDRNGVISLAAILEGEAKSPEAMSMVAGILLKRMKLGIPLQVDVAPETYKKKGVPAVPINNPGLVAISAVFHPKDSDYLYYITGKDGTMHYAKTFALHKQNIQKYLKN